MKAERLAELEHLAQHFGWSDGSEAYPGDWPEVVGELLAEVKRLRDGAPDAETFCAVPTVRCTRCGSYDMDGYDTTTCRCDPPRALRLHTVVLEGDR